LHHIARLVSDPPPNYRFELSEGGLAFAQGKQTGFEAFDAGTLVSSPTEDNLLRADLITSAIGRAAPVNGSGRKRRRAALILPDYSARVSVLDFDSFPTAAEEQSALIRFRVKKTIPFDIDAAAVSFHAQPNSSSKKTDVVAVMVAAEVIARYEAMFRGSGFHPGVVTTSTLAALALDRGAGMAVFAKLAGRALSVAVLAKNAVKLFRCVALDEASDEEILGVLHPTFAYVEDQLGGPVDRLVLCGLPQSIADGLRCQAEPLRSRYGAAGPFNAGLLGYLEMVEG
ncbi:MAG TPA: hypothetical protein VKS01_03065, partial [Bryobacteraceae bacterium]|nr:hypothetical protein [Bryobacteraceae bacterium]